MNKKILLLSLLGLVPFTSAHALAVSAETKPFLDVNYGENVLNTILTRWQKPQVQVTGVSGITIRLAKDGRPYSCEVRHHSTSIDVDNSLCQTVSQIGQFPPLKASDTGEVYLTFVHDNTPFLHAKNGEIAVDNQTANEQQIAMEGKEQVDTVRNSVASPIREIQKSAQVDVESSSIVDENVPVQPLAVPVTQNTQAPQIIQNAQSAPYHQTTATVNNTQTNAAIDPAANNSALPIATEPQPQTIRISREEALQAPSANLADPAQFVQAYSQDILRQASPKIRIPSNISGKYQVIARIDVLGEGKLKNVRITKSSQNPIIDNEILRVLSQEVRYAPLPNSEQSMWLTFNITK